MCRFIETVKILDGVIFNIDIHNHRLNGARKHFFNSPDHIDIRDHIYLCNDLLKGLVKCRIEYSRGIIKAGYEHYKMRSIRSLKLIKSEDIDYSFKYADRSMLNELLMLKGKCDDIIIIKKGLITDASFANLVFYDGFFYFTPDAPLLKGVKRAELLDKGIIKERTISINDLRNYKKVYLINAMIDLFDCEIDVNDIEM